MSTSLIANRTHVKSSNDDFGQKEQDANTALLSLDKGLRSANIGDQCEAIVRFPVLFEKYPFPILINSAFMRLADTYRSGNNFIRMCILRVVQESSKHLEKILNVDDLSKRIYSVIHSNDPLARAITLRTLGSLATILSDQTSVHHSIIVGLDSHDVVEVEAAIFAADNFAKQSRSFCESICEKLGTMTEWLSTPLDIKIKIIPILKHMHHNIYTAQKAWELCEMLLDSYPSQKFVQLTLHTMSVLSVEALVHAQQQIEILLGYIERNARQSIKLMAIKDLRLISDKAPQLWTSPYTKRLCTFVSTTKHQQSVNAVLEVLTTLSGSIAVHNLAIQPGSENYAVIVKLCDLDSRVVNSNVILLLTHLTLHHHKNQVNPSMDDLVLLIQSALLMEAEDGGNKTTPLKRCLHSMVSIYTSSLNLDPFLLEFTIDLFDSFQGKKRECVAELLAAIGHQRPDLIQPLMPKILELIRAAANSNSYGTSLVYLCTVVLQVSQTTPMPPHIHALLIGVATSCDLWLSWRVARQAMRYCQFAVADDIIMKLSKKVSTEQYYFWLSGLHHICEGESQLSNIDQHNAVERSMKALNSYQLAISALRAASTQTTTLDFQTQYTSLRSQLLRLHSQLIMSCATFRKCPPPAVAAAMASTNNQDVSRSGQVVHQLMRCAKDYDSLQQSVASLYQTCFDSDKSSLTDIDKTLMRCAKDYDSLQQSVASLYQTCFDSDKSSLTDINLLQSTCSLIHTAIMSVLQNGPLPMSKGDASTNMTSLQQITRDICEKLTGLDTHVLTYQHINALSSTATSLLKTSLPFPRYFFQKQQMTTIKLAISPQSSDPISTNVSAQLTLKVEGVIQHGPHPGLYRRVCGVVIYVTSALTTKAPTVADVKNQPITENSLQQTTEAHNDYFTTNFLLSFPVAGKHNVGVTAAVVDEDQSEWRTGPHTEFMVKAVDDSPQPAASSSAKTTH